MNKIITYLLISIFYLFSFNFNTINCYAETTVNKITENSSDLNKDKLKVQISKEVVVESGFGNNSSNGNDLIYYINIVLKYVTFFVGVVGILSVIYLSTSLIFIQDEGKIKEKKEIMVKVITGFIFYGFIAGGLYVRIIKTGKKYSVQYNNEVINETLKDGNINGPTLLKNKN